MAVSLGLDRQSSGTHEAQSSGGDKAVKVCISMPPVIYDLAERARRESGYTMSGYIQALIRIEMGLGPKWESHTAAAK